MLTSVHIENFRCIRELELTLEPLTVLVGANASGKSAVMDAIGCANQADWIPESDTRNRDPLLSVSVELVDARGFSIERCTERTIHRAHTPESRVWMPKSRDALNRRIEVRPLRFEIEAIRQARGVQAPSLQVERNGGNLLTVFESLPRRTREKIAVALGSLVPPVGDVDTFPNDRNIGTKIIKFRDRWREELWFRPEEVSDGTILLTAYLTLEHLDPAPDIVTIEEPERGLHPYLLGELVGYLRRLSQGTLAEGAKPIQVLLATHSADLLDHVEPKEVRFLSRTDDGGVRAETVPEATPEWRHAYKVNDGSLGKVWLSGGLGGTPSRATPQ